MESTMLSSLPSLTPRDSHALWYTPSHSTNPITHQEPTNPVFDHLGPLPGSQNVGPHAQRRVHQNGAQRTPLARLRADELYLERRKQNVQNYGSSWIKPPGIHKSLHQIREEKRELEEHQEALRREQLALELAEAEGDDELLQGEGPDGEMGEARDLDEDIPEAETTGLDAEDSENGVAENNGDGVAAGLPAAYQAFREAVARDEIPLPSRFGLRSSSDTDEDDQSQMLREEDLIHESDHPGGQGVGMDMDMDADLDDNVPDAETGEYEHTDTEEELDTSEDDESVDVGQLPQDRPLNTSIVRSNGTQNSLDLSSMDFQSDMSGGVSSPRYRLGIGRPGRGRHS